MININMAISATPGLPKVTEPHDTSHFISYYFPANLIETFNLIRAMDSILVLTDFSYTAYNAAKYAVNLANKLPEAKVILLHSFNNCEDPAPPYASEVQDPWIKALERLNDMQGLLELFASKTTRIEIKTDEGCLEKTIKRISDEKEVGLIVLGSKGNSDKTSFIGSNTHKLAHISEIPLLIVPPDTEFQIIQKAVFACELHETASISLRDNRNFIHLLHSKISSIFYQNESEDFDPRAAKHLKALYQLLDSIEPNLSYVQGEQAVESTISFALNNDMQLVTIILKTPAFLDTILHPNPVSQLAQYADFPILVLKPVNFKKEFSDRDKEKNNRKKHETAEDRL
ncbi:universal stress protein [Desertivirga arenae]|uniref:universal stress protein n=1 Tax=Desertivirga arenae TaxID=2810309 RepID=UPI001A972386|nr:universal stress protein [Pedobacter sp. SYSU D00823]